MLWVVARSIRTKPRIEARSWAEISRRACKYGVLGKIRPSYIPDHCSCFITGFENTSLLLVAVVCIGNN